MLLYDANGPLPQFMGSTNPITIGKNRHPDKTDALFEYKLEDITSFLLSSLRIANGTLTIKIQTKAIAIAIRLNRRIVKPENVSSSMEGQRMLLKCVASEEE